MPTEPAPSPREHRMYHIISMPNPDLATLVEMIDQRLVETLMSASGAVDGYMQPDINRQKDYIAELRAKKAWIVARPEPDRPQQHPEQHGIDYISNKETIKDPVTGEDEVLVQKPENMAARDVAQQYRQLMATVALSASRMRPAGMNEHDSRRFDEEINRLEILFTDYIETQLPVDLPETNPSAQLTGHGFA